MVPVWMVVWMLLEPPHVATGAAALRPGGEAQRSLTGAGVTIGLWDRGFPRITHEAFATDRVATVGTALTDNHATGAAGAMIGLGMGQAPGAGITARRFTDSFANDLAAIRAAADGGLRLSAHPYEYAAGWAYDAAGWGSLSATCAYPTVWAWFGTETESMTRDVIFGRYHQRSADWDGAAFDHPRWLPFIAAGNQEGTGPDTQPTAHCVYDWSLSQWVVRSDERDLDSGITYMGVSKNGVTVGTWPNVSTSGRGPATDGRIKPDLVAPAELTDAPTSATDSSYGTFTQTSAAVSVATGAAALLLEHLRLTWESDPLASTIKALLIHSAVDKGDAGPDGIYGWGLIDIERAVRYADLAQVVEDQLADGGDFSLSVTHDGFGDLVATLVWTDPPGTPGGAALVNDLDLRITGPGGPWLPLASGGGTADNLVDNVEQVRVGGLAAGAYDIRVSHKGVLVEPQSFSLVVHSGDPRRRRFTLDQAGWRLVALPFRNSTFQRLGESFVTQFGDGDDPTIYRFTAPADYSPVTDANAAIQPGEGFLMYVFDEDAPKNWVMNGDPNIDRIETAMPWYGSPADSYLLAGNPFTGVLDWEAVLAASTGIANTYYVWDPDGVSGGGSAGFRHYTAGNPGVGTTGRHIPAFTGFFVFATEPDAVLVLDPAHMVKGTQPVHHGKTQAAYPMVRLAGEHGEAVISFHPEAREGWDAYDVPSMASLDRRMSLSIMDSGRDFAVLAVPKPDSTRRYRLNAPARITHADMPARMVDDRTVEVGTATLPVETALLSAYPNPFNPETVIAFDVTGAHGGTPVRLSVYDVLGREVAVLVDGVVPAGSHQVLFDAKGLASGVYVVNLSAEGHSRHIRITLIR